MRMKSLLLVVIVLIGAGRVGLAWDLPADNATLGRPVITEILAGTEYPETSSYTQRVEFIDFSAHGQTFTQVVITLTPDKPKLRNGRRLVVVGGEPGSEYGMDFVSTVEKRDGPAIWLARRGITFVALTRVGRWNFLAPGNDGSWETIPLDQRMPIFSRSQKTNWARTDYEVKSSGVAVTSSPSASAFYRFPKSGTALEQQMLAGHAAGISAGIPSRARESDPRSTQRLRALLGDVNRRREPLPAGEALHARWLSWVGNQHHWSRLPE
jgi:hypothetical protein